MNNAEWYEDRKVESDGLERFLIRAERDKSGNWRFYERSVWEIMWYDLPSTPELIRKAEEKLKRKY